MAGNRHRVRGVIAAIGLAVLGSSQAGAISLTEAERKAICAEADARYLQLFGKPAASEPFVIVLMYKDTFCPQELSVKRGARLRWINVDRRTSHSVWFKESGRPESDRLFPEEVLGLVVDLPPGVHPYLCGPHWEREGMAGRLTVTGD